MIIDTFISRLLSHLIYNLLDKFLLIHVLQTIITIKKNAS